MNTVIMIGRLIRDPELTADFFNIVVWGKRAETCVNYLAKGRMVAIRGRLQNNNYTDKDGTKRYNVEIIAEEVKFIDWGDKNNASSTGSQNNSQYDGIDEEGYRAMQDDDVPF